MATKQFNTAKRGKSAIKFQIEGEEHEYSFTAPKTAGMALSIMDSSDELIEINAMRATFDWLEEGLTEGDAERIKARLRDPKDDLDIDTLGDITEWLREEVSGNPST